MPVAARPEEPRTHMPRTGHNRDHSARCRRRISQKPTAVCKGAKIFSGPSRRAGFSPYRSQDPVPLRGISRHGARGTAARRSGGSMRGPHEVRKLQDYLEKLVPGS